jgi:uncharacterized protein YhaN
MRLRRLDLTRYGKFTNYAIDFGPKRTGPDLHIVYGLNEAGKSTALSAYLDLLFGIENNSRFDFLHSYSTMRIGGRLEFSGDEHELVRVKTRANSLLDKAGQPVPEALLSVPLAGLTRDTYRSMFSLDDQSLEQGGNAIISSKGELGELLFAASAGLADLGANLARVREEADTIFKQRGRNTRIAELKRSLDELKKQREAIDTRAAAHAALASARTQAEAAYAHAMREQAEARTRHDDIQRILRAAPLAAEWARVQQDLSHYSELPSPPAEWSGRLPSLMIKNAELRKQIEGTQADIARLEAESAELVIDEDILALSGNIAALAEGMARFSTAENDLPRRLAAIGEDEAAISAILVALGQAGHAAPDTLLLAAPLVGALRELIEARSGVDAKLETARRELQQARESLERANEDIAKADGRGVADGVGLAILNKALGALRSGDHRTRMRLSERNSPQYERRLNAAMEALAPWSGSGDDLRAISVPSSRQIEHWRRRIDDLEKREAEHGSKQDELVTRMAEIEARLVAIRTAAGAIDDEEAARLRQARDAAWTAHAAALDTSTAAAFAQALAADDRLAAARLNHVQDLAEWRSLQRDLAVAKASQARGAELLAALRSERNALGEEIRSSVANEALLPRSSNPVNWLNHMEAWIAGRTEALAHWDALQQAQDEYRNAKTDLEHDIAVLRQAMAACGFPNVDELPVDALLAAAEAALTEAEALGAARSAGERALRQRESELGLREQALAQAQAAADQWEERWTEAVGQTWFPYSGVGAVREILRALGDLPAALAQRNGRARQIQTMQRDQQLFVADLEALLLPLGEPLDRNAVLETARLLHRRLEQAEQDQRLLTGKSAELKRLQNILHGLTQELEVHDIGRAEMTSFFGVATLEEVSTALERTAERDRLRRHGDALGKQILSELRAESLQEALDRLKELELAEVERDAAEIGARLEDLEAASRQRFADQLSAQQRLEAVGGDDAVARIEAQRRTVLLQIEDLALDYLRLRTGALVAEKALQAYREQHRSSMMDRASEAFAMITRGDYSGLAAHAEKDRETLIGLPRQGGSRLATDMSKGTQFQLYLALRLAGYQEFARSRPSVPFIADDIMETFDEPRSEEVFRLLGEMANIGQVIYLTHHRHLCQIAQAAVPSVTIHELSTA